MARSDAEASKVRATVLDRLTGRNGGGRRAFGGIGLRDLHHAVIRDLDELLNTVNWCPYELEGMPESASSNLTYGIPDLSVYSWTSPGDRTEICRRIEQVIRNFETRLLPRTVKVHLVETEAIEDFTVRLRIDAVLSVEPFHEPISFDTDIELSTGAVSVKGAR
jgi:type VI secretion system protein ImpF